MTTQVQSAKTQQGFSLIELLVVVAIIGVLAAAGVVGYTSYLDNVKADTHRNNTLSIGKAISLNAVAKNGNLAVNPAECSGARVDISDLPGAPGSTLPAYGAGLLTGITGAGAGGGVDASKAKHFAMLVCVRKVALDAKFKSPFSSAAGGATEATIAAYITQTPTSTGSGVSPAIADFDPRNPDNTVCNSNHSNATTFSDVDGARLAANTSTDPLNENRGKILVHHKTDISGTMKTYIMACSEPKAGNGSIVIKDSITEINYLN